MILDAELGRIEFTTSTRAKRINIHITVDSLLVKMPLGCSEKRAVEMIERERVLLLKKQKRIKERTANNAIFISPETELKTFTFNVNAQKSKRENVHFLLKNNLLTIEFPEDLDYTGKEAQKAFWNGINYFLRKEAKRVLPTRIAELAKEYNFTYSTIKIQSSTSRWGSCSSSKSINLSFYLLLLPQHLIDYVILHELCHTKEMNHSAKFWQWMDKVTGNKSTELNQELKKYSIPRL